LDYAASTPVDKKVLKAMMPYIKEQYGNPSSIHSFGQSARAAIEKSREQMARFLHCEADEIIFTSGATEANNLAIQGVLQEARNKRQDIKPHIVTTAIEHESVLDPCRALEKQGLAEVTYVKPQRDGIVTVQDIQEAIRPNTVLVSVMYANSQIGTIQPVEGIGGVIAQRKSNNNGVYPVFHIDAVQAANFLDCTVDFLHGDLITLSGHKIYGPKGVGVLYVRHNTPISSINRGGGQEMGMRSGTENVAAIVGMGQAVEELSSTRRKNQNKNMKELQNIFIEQVTRQISEAELTGSMEKRLPNNIHLRFARVNAYDLVVLLDQRGVASSVGSACSEKTQEPSYVLRAMGLNDTEAGSAVRFTLGKDTTAKELRKAVTILVESVAQLQKVTIQ